MFGLRDAIPAWLEVLLEFAKDVVGKNGTKSAWKRLPPSSLLKGILWKVGIAPDPTNI